MDKIFRIPIVILVGFLALAMVSSAWSQPTIAIEDLDPDCNGMGSIALDVNEFSEVVGVNYSPSQHGFLWTPQDGYQNIGGIGATGINDIGQVVGSLSAGDGNWHAFVWTALTGMLDITPDDYYRSIAAAINNQGQVAGCYNCCFPLNWGCGESRAFLWMEESGFQDLGIPNSMAVDINENGQVVGNSFSGAFIWAPPNDVTFITIEGGAYDLVATGINDAGQVVGYYTTEEDNRYAFRWSQEIGFEGLTAIGYPTYAYHINDMGQIVGYKTSNGIEHAFLWSDEIQILDLIGLSDGFGSIALRNNNSGNIVGLSKTGIDTSTCSHAVLWTVELPAPTPDEGISLIAAKVKLLVSSNVLNRGEGNALNSKLDAATLQLNKIHYTATRNLLEAFSTHVEVYIQIGKLSSAQGQTLINSANTVINQLP